MQRLPCFVDTVVLSAAAAATAVVAAAVDVVALVRSFAVVACINSVGRRFGVRRLLFGFCFFA